MMKNYSGTIIVDNNSGIVFIYNNQYIDYNLQKYCLLCPQHGDVRGNTPGDGNIENIELSINLIQKYTA